MDILVKDVPAGRFFATADPPPDNVWIMHVPPRYQRSKTIKGRKRAMLLLPGLCQNINTSAYFHIDGNRTVRLIREDEHDQTEFHVLPGPSLIGLASAHARCSNAGRREEPYSREEPYVRHAVDRIAAAATPPAGGAPA